MSEDPLYICDFGCGEHAQENWLGSDSGIVISTLKEATGRLLGESKQIYVDGIDIIDGVRGFDQEGVSFQSISPYSSMDQLGKDRVYDSIYLINPNPDMFSDSPRQIVSDSGKGISKIRELVKHRLKKGGLLTVHLGGDWTIMDNIHSYHRHYRQIVMTKLTLLSGVRKIYQHTGKSAPEIFPYTCLPYRHGETRIYQKS